MKRNPPSTTAGQNRQPSDHQPKQYVLPDADYISDLEQSDGQRRKRMNQRMRGKRVTPPREP